MGFGHHQAPPLQNPKSPIKFSPLKYFTISTSYSSSSFKYQKYSKLVLYLMVHLLPQITSILTNIF